MFALVDVDGLDEGGFDDILDLMPLACGNDAYLLQDIGVDNRGEALLVAGLLQRFFAVVCLFRLMTSWPLW